jgi:hypothetical protein
MRIEQASLNVVTDLWYDVEAQIVVAGSLEEGAQALTRALYDHFEESIVLARVFATIQFGDLPTENVTFVRRMAGAAGALAELKDKTPILSLIGSFGLEESWRDRRNSKGHLGIPIVSSPFIQEIPMMSRLLKELGVPVGWVDSHDTEMIVSAIGNTTGLFFVENAETGKDTDGRHIIAEQGFVSDYGVKSVFGVGGGYPTGEITFIVVFCKSQFPRAVAERFLSLAAYFIGKTTGLVERGRVFKV